MNNSNSPINQNKKKIDINKQPIPPNGLLLLLILIGFSGVSCLLINLFKLAGPIEEVGQGLRGLFIAAIIIGFTAFLYFRYKDKKELFEKEVADINQEKKRIADELEAMDRMPYENFVESINFIISNDAVRTKINFNPTKVSIIEISGFKNGEIILVHVIKTFEKIGVPEVRKLYETVMNNGYSFGYYVTNENFTKQALDYVKDKKITLFDQNKILSLSETRNFSWVKKLNEIKN